MLQVSKMLLNKFWKGSARVYRRSVRGPLPNDGRRLETSILWEDQIRVLHRQLDWKDYQEICYSNQTKHPPLHQDRQGWNTVDQNSV